ncbi:MAG: hypothetical protein RR779_13165 [Comamonas sp.]
MPVPVSVLEGKDTTGQWLPYGYGKAMPGQSKNALFPAETA